MKQLLITIAAVVLVGCGTQPQSPRKSLILEIEEGNTAKVIEMINEGADINARDIFQKTPLHAAARKNNTEIMELLISKGADIEATVPDFKFTPLFDAAMFGKKEAIQLLIQKGAKVNAKTLAGETPVDFALGTEAADLLRKHGGKTGEELKAEGK